MTFITLCENEIAGPPSRDALAYLAELFGRRGRPGVGMAVRALRIAMPAERVEAICTAYTTQLLEVIRSKE